jgi:hypothetical protein
MEPPWRLEGLVFQRFFEALIKSCGKFWVIQGKVESGASKYFPSSNIIFSVNTDELI